MLVKDLMSWPVITVFENSTIGEALDVLRRKNIRHLPVIDLEQSLVGVVSETDLIKVFPNGKELSTFETNLLARTPVSRVMCPNPVVASPGDILEQAALVMRTSRISCLPVLDENRKLIGLLSKNDILDAFIDSMGLYEEGTRITVKYRKKWGFMSELVAFADKRNICIVNIVTLSNELVLKVKGKSQDFINDLRSSGYMITDINYIDPPQKAKAE